jgi:hypothetical protein
VLLGRRGGSVLFYECRVCLNNRDLNVSLLATVFELALRFFLPQLEGEGLKPFRCIEVSVSVTPLRLSKVIRVEKCSCSHAFLPLFFSIFRTSPTLEQFVSSIA